MIFSITNVTMTIFTEHSGFHLAFAVETQLDGPIDTKTFFRRVEEALSREFSANVVTSPPLDEQLRRIRVPAEGSAEFSRQIRETQGSLAGNAASHYRAAVVIDAPIRRNHAPRAGVVPRPEITGPFDHPSDPSSASAITSASSRSTGSSRSRSNTTGTSAPTST